jgi:hypothetical protein
MNPNLSNALLNRMSKVAMFIAIKKVIGDFSSSSKPKNFLEV